MINEVIKKIINNEKPDKTELLESFDEFFSGIADEITSTSFITLLSAYLNKLKDYEDVEGLAACVKSANSAISAINPQISSDYCLQTAEFNLKSKYFNVLFARDIILAANNIPVIRCGYTSSTEENKLRAMINKFDIYACEKNNDKFDFEDFEKTNFCYLLLDDTEKYYKYSKNISKKLCFENILNLSDKMLNPCGIKNITIGYNKKEDVEKMARLCLELGYQNSLIISSDDNIPFVTPEKESYIAEAWKNKVFAYKLSNELVGLKSYPIKEIETLNLDEAFEKVNSLFQNKLTSTALYDTVILNSALSLYIVKKADSIMDGMELAKKTIETNIAYEKLISLKK